MRNNGLTIQHITLEKTNTPNDSIKATVKLAPNEALKTSRRTINQSHVIEVTLERQSEPSGVKTTVVRVVEVETLNINFSKTNFTQPLLHLHRGFYF